MSSTLQLATEATQSSFQGKEHGLFPNLQPLLLGVHNLEEFLDTFFFETQPWMHYNGMTFTNDNKRIDYSVGLDAENRCSYRLFAYHNYLGDISFTREYRFEEDELEIIDELLSATLAPLSQLLA